MDARSPNRQSGPVSAAVATESERMRAFGMARRHSLLVKNLRWLLPAAGLLMVLAAGIGLRTSWKLGHGHLDVGKIEVTADDLVMQNPRYFGVTKDGGRYEVEAKKAVMDFEQNEPVRLFDISGNLTQDNGVATKIKSVRGLFDNKKSELELFDGIEIDASNGMSIRMTRAKVFNKEHRIVSNEPIAATTPTGAVKAQSMTLLTQARRANFKGAVEVRMVQSAQPGETGLGIGRDARQPINVRAEELSVDDGTKLATFQRNVIATQGESTLRAPVLDITYEGKAELPGMSAAPAATPQGQGQSQGQNQGQSQAQPQSKLSRLVARSGIVITQGSDRRIASDIVDFDAKADTILFDGGVLINQGRNMLQGGRLNIDRKAGRSHLETPALPGRPAGRIAASFYQTDAGAAQKPKASTNPLAAASDSLLGSFKTDPNAPIEIEADTLDVNDAAKVAIFRGTVRAKQGDVTVRSAELDAFYAGQAGFGMTSPADGPDGKPSTQLTRIEAKRNVQVTSKDGQSAIGDWANFDVKSNTVVMGGARVVVTRGKDVVQGTRLRIDLTTGQYRFEVDHDAPQPAPVATPQGPAPPPSAPTAANPTGRVCPPGKTCVLFYPKDAKEAAKRIREKNSAAPSDGWAPATSASPVLKGN